MNKQLILIFFVAALSSCNQKKEVPTDIVEKTTDSVVAEKITKDSVETKQKPSYHLPQWLLHSDVITTAVLDKNYAIETRLKPNYLEEDFNGDGHLDVVFPVSNTKDNKKGFAVVHGKTFDVFILGAGKMFKNALDDNQNYIDQWRINHKKENEPGVEEETGNGKNGILILENPSIEIDNTEVGGGQIYWNGKEYAYFHQTA